MPDFIPVAAISDLLLSPGEEFDYDGRRLTYPDIRLVYWAGGNPFHHHQDLPRLRRAFARPDTIVVHDPYWTPMARNADIVVPSTTSLERNDLSCTRNDPLLVAMQQVVPPFANSRDDYDTFAALASALGFGEQFTEGRSSQEWIEHLYGQWRPFVDADGGNTPTFEVFWSDGHYRMRTEDNLVLFGDFREDPEKYPLSTPSGKIEIFSETIESFGYDDCAGHPRWYEPDEWLGGPRATQFPLHLIANQPKTRLHSQLDHGAASQASKIQGREPIRMHPDAAAQRGVSAGDVVRVFNDRGACLAGVIVDSDLRSDVVQLSTGAWYDPLDPADPDSLCVHGNPNVLTPDVGTSSLSHGCTGQHVLVQIEKFEGVLPPVKAFDPPVLRSR
ncbi:putative biotin sulfoxide reductase [Rhodococcus erythropolis]|nr:putative biotin sulfoxide reductase [Rhodococcus erythropolis]